MPDFGANYPLEIERDGRVFKLSRETRWNRRFSSEDNKVHVHISRIHDGSATITPEQLETEWIKWSTNEKKDFCDAITWLPEPGRERICRFLKQHGSPEVLHNCVLDIAANLPASESVPWLTNCLGQRPPGTASNFLQALAYTKAPEAAPQIRKRLEECFSHSGFAKDDRFLNWIAAEGLDSIKYLIEFGSPPAEFRSHALKLANHSCARVRQSFDHWLRKHYGDDPEIDPNTHRESAGN